MNLSNFNKIKGFKILENLLKFFQRFRKIINQIKKPIYL